MSRWPSDENLETLVVSLTAEGEYFISVGATGEDRQSVTLETLGAQVGHHHQYEPEHTGSG